MTPQDHRILFYRAETYIEGKRNFEGRADAAGDVSARAPDSGRSSASEGSGTAVQDGFTMSRSQ